MNYKTKSIVIGRKKRVEDHYPVFIHLFEINDPHLTDKVPFEMLEYDNIQKVELCGLCVEYWPFGSDIVINDLESIEVEQKEDLLIIKGKQKKH
ncbi:hypothetical protein JW968_00610 [Candidatus Woesearchaeota archaeon]|nr:hypothetical protein [Candidatus Woesearchaeota archaeon]